MTDQPSKNEIVVGRIALALLFGLAVAGVFWYGFSTKELERVGEILSPGLAVR